MLISIDVVCLYLLFRSSDGIVPGTDVIVPALWYRC